MGVTAPQQEALGIDEILRSIYGFVLGTDLITFTGRMKMQMRLVSQHFNRCFIAYLKSAPLRLHEFGCNVNRIVKWMKCHDITRLFELSVSGIGLQRRANVDFTGLDFSNLSVLHFTIWPSSTQYNEEQLQHFLSLFSEASSVTQLTLYGGRNSTSSSVIIYTKFLSYFPNLKSLDVGIGSYNIADINGIYRSIEKCPQLERLVQHNLIGNYTLRSHSLKFLNLNSRDLDSICLDCPSLEKLVCHNPIVIGNTSGSALAEEFGVDDVAFIKEYQEIYGSMLGSNIIRAASMSIIPSDFIVSTTNEFFRVGNNCRITLFALR